MKRLADRAAVSHWMIYALEKGLRRRGTVTLAALAWGLDPDDFEPMRARLVAAAGPDLRRSSDGWARYHARHVGQALAAGQLALPSDLQDRIDAWRFFHKVQAEAFSLIDGPATLEDLDRAQNLLAEAAELREFAGPAITIHAPGVSLQFGPAGYGRVAGARQGVFSTLGKDRPDDR